MSKKNSHSYEFGPFRLDLTEKVFLKEQELIPLKPKAFETLVFLVQKNGHVVEKDELMEAVWPESYVSETSLTQNIYQIRRALGDKPDGTPYVETIPRRGYRFKADVHEIQGDDETEIVYQRARAHVLIEEEIEDAETLSEADPNHSITPRQEAAIVKAIDEPQPATVTKTKLQQLITKRNVIAFCVLLAVGLATFGLWRWRRTNATTLGYQPKSVAILPFKPLDQNENEQLGLGMADALISKLSSQQQLQVKPTSAIIKYTGREHNAIDVGRQLGVDVVVEGTVQRAENRIRVTVQVLDVKSERAVWSGKFDEPFTDIFFVQDKISERVSETLALQLNPIERKRLWKRHTNNTEAYQDYITGNFFWNKRTKDDLARAVDYLKRAIQKDPNYALAYATLADCYYLQAYYRYENLPSREEAFKRVEMEANKALSLDETLAEAHITLGSATLTFKGDFAKAEASYQRGLMLNPNYAAGHLRYAWLLHIKERMPEAEREMRKAQELDPLSPVTNAALGGLLLSKRDYDESIKYSRHAIELDQSVPAARFNLAEALRQKKLYDEAIAEYQKVMANEDERHMAVQGMAMANAFAGRKEEAKKYLDQMYEIDKQRKLPLVNFAIVYAALGDKDKAFEILNRVEPGQRSIAFLLRNDPDVDSLRNDPRFAPLLEKHTLNAKRIKLYGE